jgi:sodium transport system permease protein
MTGWRTIRLILLKELREVMRDRRTLFLMLGIPVVLYPALFVLMEQVLLFGESALGNLVPRIAVQYVDGSNRTLPLEDVEGIDVVPLQHVDSATIRSGRLDAAVLVRSTGPPEARGFDVEILYDGSRDRSIRARSVLLAKLDSLNDTTLSRRLEEFGLPAEFARPVNVEDTSVATARGLGGATLGRFLPMVLILMTVLGAFHPAIDIAAGERERRTLEPLLTTSVASSAIVVGKYFAVAVLSFTAAALNLASMLLTLRSGLFQFASELGIEFDLPAVAIVLTLGLLTLLAFLFSALFLGVAVHAQSFREAQTSLTPIYIVSFLPAIVTMAPGIEFTPGLAIIPIAGIAMLFQSLMAGEPVGLNGFLAVSATIAYASLALSFAARSFGREDVLLGDDEDAEVGRRERKPWWNRDGSSVPAPRPALIFVAVLAVLYFYVGLGFQQWGEVGILASQWLLLALPTGIFLHMGRFQWRESIGFRKAAPSAFLAGLLVILGGLPFGWLIGWVQGFFLEVPEELLTGLQNILTGDNPFRIAWLLLLVAVTPALCEEVVFRGILLNGFLRKMSGPAAILASSFVFGVFHLSFESAIRLLPTMFLGALLALVVVRTGSILPAVMMHFVNNATAVVLVSTPSLQRLLLSEDGGPNWLLLPPAALCLLMGVYLLRRPFPSPHLQVSTESSGA